MCNSIFDANSLSRGYPAKLENYGNSRGGGGMTKVPSVGGGECVFFGATQLIAIREDTSLSLHMGCTSGRSDENTHPLPTPPPPQKKDGLVVQCGMGLL